jgi:hypothetical protein
VVSKIRYFAKINILTGKRHKAALTKNGRNFTK